MNEDQIEAYILAQRAFRKADEDLAKYKEALEIFGTFIKTRSETKIFDWEVKMIMEQVEQKLL